MELVFHALFAPVLLILIVSACIIFTNAVEHLGQKLELGEGAVGSIFAAVGTALPETVVPLVAILGALISGSDVEASREIGVGAILGAPFLLVTLGMFMSGTAVVIFAFLKKRSIETEVNSRVILRDIKFFIVSYSAVILAGFLQNGLKYLIAIFLLFYYAFYVYRTIIKSSNSQNSHSKLEKLFICKVFGLCNVNLKVITIQIIISLLLLVYFAHLFVGEIKFFATEFNINPLILSLIVAPIATELPEKVNSILWMGQKKRHACAWKHNRGNGFPKLHSRRCRNFTHPLGFRD